MSTQPPQPPPASPSSLRVIGQWLLSGGLFVGLLTTMVQCHNERENARVAAVQTYNMGRVAAFRDSGAELDKRIAAFNDAAAEGRDLKEARAAVRSAFADHAARAYAMKDVFGKAPTSAYFAALKNLQQALDDTTGPRNSGPIITAMSVMLVQRNQLADKAADHATA